MKFLFWVALASSVVGLLVLFCVTPDVSPQHIVISGEVLNVNNRGKVSFINFVPDDFLVVTFKDLDLESGHYELVGKLQPYDGRVEFIVESIR